MAIPSRRAGGAGELRRVGILGIDNFSRKNRTQVAELNARGFRFDIFTNDALGDSAANVPPGNTLTVLAAGPAARMRQLARYLRRHRGSLNHVEIYPGGRFAGICAALARASGVPMMVIERGDLLYESRYDGVTRASMRACYRLAHTVWFREPYQEERLRAHGARDLFFLGNAVAMPRVDLSTAVRATDFAWVNRLIVERRADWVVDVLAEPAFAQVGATMLGFLDGPIADEGMRAQQAYVTSRRLRNLQTASYGDPSALYRTARYFLLPSEIVFCNNALLEAMAHGVVPLVSDVADARRIVEHGVDGFVFPHSREGLREAMAHAMALSAADHARLSRNAMGKVQTHFSIARWCDRLVEQYDRLASATV